MIRATRNASSVIRSARRRVTAGSSSLAMVSASSPRAPTGVLSSWLMLATKSRRTASSRRRSETSSITATAPVTWVPSSRGTAETTRIRRGGPNRSRSRRRDEPARADASSSLTACSTSASPWRAPAKAAATSLRKTSRPASSQTTTPWGMACRAAHEPLGRAPPPRLARPRDGAASPFGHPDPGPGIARSTRRRGDAGGDGDHQAGDGEHGDHRPRPARTGGHSGAPAEERWRRRSRPGRRRRRHGSRRASVMAA